MKTSSSFKKYLAYISYSKKDNKWAKWLHNKLENYSIPKEFQDIEFADGVTIGKNLKPIFRVCNESADRTELGDTIAHALFDSHYLIVLCSRNSAQSHRVNKEIADFKAINPINEKRILTIILNGEPNATNRKNSADSEECFPPSLRYPMEPLAGDLRAEGDGKERAIIKLLAGISQIDFDKFYRRHERSQRKKRTLIASIYIAAIIPLLVLTVFAFRQSSHAMKMQSEEEKARLVSQGSQQAAEQVINQMIHDVSPRLRVENMGHLAEKISILSDSYYLQFSDTYQSDIRKKISQARNDRIFAQEALHNGLPTEAKIKASEALEKYARLRVNANKRQEIDYEIIRLHFLLSDIATQTTGEKKALNHDLQAVKYSEDLFTINDYDEYRRLLIEAYQRSASSLIALGKGEMALPHVKKSLDHCSILHGKEPSPDNKELLASGRKIFGELHMKSGKKKLARPHLEKNVEILEAVNSIKNSVTSKKQLAFAHIELGKLLVSTGSGIVASNHKNTPIELLLSVYLKYPTAENKYNYALAVELQCDFNALKSRALGKDAYPRKDIYKALVSLAEDIHKNVPTLQSKRLLIRSYKKKAAYIIRYRVSKRKTAQIYLRNEIKLIKEIQNIHFSENAEIELAIAFRQLGLTHNRPIKNKTERDAAFNEAISILAKLNTKGNPRAISWYNGIKKQLIKLQDKD